MLHSYVPLDAGTSAVKCGPGSALGRWTEGFVTVELEAEDRK